MSSLARTAGTGGVIPNAKLSSRKKIRCQMQKHPKRKKKEKEEYSNCDRSNIYIFLNGGADPGAVQSTLRRKDGDGGAHCRHSQGRPPSNAIAVEDKKLAGASRHQ